MEPHEKDELRARLLRGMGKEKSYEEKKRLRELAKQRKAEERRPQHRRGAWREEDESDADDAIDFEPRVKRERLPRADPRTEPRASTSSAREPSAELALEAARVLALAPGRALVRCGEEELDLPLAPELRREQQSAIAVGDVAQLEERAVVRAVAPRKSWLSRPDPAHPRRERVLAANVDLAVIVASVAAPPFKPGLVERLLMALERGRVPALVAVNKADLVDEAKGAVLERSFASWRALGVPYLLVSAETGSGLQELREALDGRLCVFVGHSGVGKSSLLNALVPSLARTTGAVRRSDGKGRHTTTRSELIELWARTEAIDTPGVRQFGLWNLDRAGVRAHFEELAPLARGCRFRDCSHLVEPGCAVRAAVEEGRLARARFELYARLYAEAERKD